MSVKMRPRVRKSGFLLPSGAVGAFGRARGDLSRKDLLKLSLGFSSGWQDEKIRQKTKGYVTWIELQKYRQNLIELWLNLIYLLLVFRAPVEVEHRAPMEVEHRAPVGVDHPWVAITDMAVRPTARTGDVVPVHVSITNTATNKEEAEVTLTDTTENALIGKQRITLPPRSSRVLRFGWKTKSFWPGDHILDARITRPWMRTASVRRQPVYQSV